MFFPEHVSALQQDRFENDIEIDVSNPILMGYIFSRPDNIVKKPPPPMRAVGSDSEEPLDMIERNEPQPRTTMSTSNVFPFAHGSSSSSATKRMKTTRSSSIYGLNAFNTIGEPRETKRTNISGFTLDYYQHPAKHADPQRLYRHAYDVYSLGILLVEIGLWTNLQVYDDVSDDEDNEDHYERRRRICREYLPPLRWCCGQTYAEVALKCLMIDCSDDEAGMASERELCAKIVADLEGCRA
jgi:hypothetical protein